jgi:hypothetical protein
MNYEVEMESGVMLYIPSLIKIDSVIQELTQTAWRSHKPTFIFLNKEVRLKRTVTQLNKGNMPLSADVSNKIKQYR